MSTATTMLHGVTVAKVLRFESILVSASSTADGDAGNSAAAVRVSGAAVADTPVEVTGNGIVASGTSVPISNETLTETLKAAGLELLAPGAQTMRPAGRNSSAEARGPSFRLTTAEGHRMEFSLGLASTSSVLFRAADSATEAAAGPAGPVQQAQTQPVGSGAVVGESLAGTPGDGRAADPASAYGEPVVPAKPGQEGWALASSEPITDMPSGTGLPVDSTLNADLENLPERWAAMQQASSLPPAPESIVLASQRAADRVGTVYGAIAVAALLIGLVSFGVPAGDRWAEDV
ncbi:MAG: hypothetical protein AB1679_11030 [Actinomycetota bacterium]